MAKQVLDLYMLYKLVTEKGGLVEVINKKIWREITKGLNLPTSITSAAFTLRTQWVLAVSTDNNPTWLRHWAVEVKNCHLHSKNSIFYVCFIWLHMPTPAWLHLTATAVMSLTCQHVWYWINILMNRKSDCKCDWFIQWHAPFWVEDWLSFFGFWSVLPSQKSTHCDDESLGNSSFLQIYEVPLSIRMWKEGTKFPYWASGSYR